MIELQSNPTLIRRAKFLELKYHLDFGDYHLLKFLRSDDPIPHSGGQAYTLYVCNTKRVVLGETYILKYDI